MIGPLGDCAGELEKKSLLAIFMLETFNGLVTDMKITSLSQKTYMSFISFISSG